MFVRSVFLCSALLLSAPAFADTLALSPLLADATVRPEDRVGVHQVLSSELDFAPEVSSVLELTKVPAGLDDWCLTNARCMTGVSNALEVDGIVAGRISMAEANLVLDLVYFVNGAVVRRQAFVVPRDPTGLADAMSPVARELLTGVNPRAVAEAAPTEDDFTLEDDDIEIGAGTTPANDFDIGSADPDEIAVAALEAPPPQRGTAAAPPPPAGSSEQPTRTTARRADPAPRRAPEAPPTRGGTRAASTSVARAAPPRRSTASEAQLRTRTAYDRSRFEITARGGYSPYYTFDFVTGGAEAALRVSGGLQLVAGVELYAVNRQLPERVRAIEGKCCQWDSIYPVNFGFLYEFGDGELRPYIGVDGIVTQYYRDEVGGDDAGGARARVGLDYMVSNHFGLNVNVAAGAWTGENWPLIEQTLGQTGFLPQVSGGTVFAF